MKVSEKEIAKVRKMLSSFEKKTGTISEFAWKTVNGPCTITPCTNTCYHSCQYSKRM